MKEEVLIRKLIADGEGGGEERKFSQIGSFLREIRKHGEPKIADAIKCLKALDSLEFSVLKQKQVASMSKVQSSDFVKFSEDVEEQIAETYRTMEEAKQKLAEARIVKRNRQEYSTIVSVIEEVPSRAETAVRLGEVRDELERLHERQRVLETKLNDRRNHIHAWNVMLFKCSSFTEEDNSVEEGEEEEERGSSEKDKNETESNDSDEKKKRGDSIEKVAAEPEPMSL